MDKTFEEIFQQGVEASKSSPAWKNPYLRRSAMPKNTEESIKKWVVEFDAWERGWNAEDQRLTQGREHEKFASIVRRISRQNK